MTRTISRVALVAAVVCLTAVGSLAQPTSTTETKTFEVLAVDGNQLVVALPEGTKELTVADDFRFNVNGQMLSVQQLKPGMKGSATITTRTTVIPVTVTEVRNGTVVETAGSTIIVRTSDNVVKSFSQGEIDKRGVKIMRSGKPAQLSEFRKGDKLSATIITTSPPKVLTEKEVQATLAAAKPAASAPPVAAAPAAAAPMAPAPTAAKSLPKTASSWPLLLLASGLSLALGFALTIRRRLAS